MPYYIVDRVGEACDECARTFALGERIIVTPIGGGWGKACLPCLPIVTWHADVWATGSEHADDPDRMPDWTGKVRARTDYRAQCAAEHRARRAARSNGFDPGTATDASISGPLEHCSDVDAITKHRPGCDDQGAHQPDCQCDGGEPRF